MASSNAELTLIEGSGGAFEIIRDGTLVYSKHATKRFPDDSEIDSIAAG